MLRGKLVLVTGGTGFIGSRLVEKLVLEERANVRVLIRNLARAPRIACFPIEIVKGDIIDVSVVREAARGCDVVYHCAHEFGGSREFRRKVSIEGTQNVAQAVLQEGIRCMVYLSTFAVYGVTSNGDLTESSPWQHSRNHYTLVKRTIERSLSDLRQRADLPVVILQPTIVYGPFSNTWTVDPLNRLKTGLVPIVNGGSGTCNAVFVDDLVSSMILAASRPDAAGETFLISGKAPVTWNAFYGALEDILGFKRTIEVSEDQLRRAIKQKSQPPALLPMLLDLARNPEVFEQLTSLPIAQTSLRLLKNCLSESRWNRLKDQYGGGSADRRPSRQPRQELHLPDELLLSLYLSQTRVRIDKASRVLGYVPQFSFERGMEITARFARWANLT